jgi:Carbohydrate binding module (family 6)
MKLLSRSIALAVASLGCTRALTPSTGASPDARLSSVAASQAQRTNHYSPFPADYRCVPFHDARYSGGPQRIPGRVQNEYYDQLDVGSDAQSQGAEEGVCYHDTDNKNSGSGPGALNGTGSYEKEFRMHESPDISYVKLHNPNVAIDDSPYDLVRPDSNALYLGWIAPGEWVRYTVDVTQEGWYSITTLYTSKFGGHISLDVNGVDATGPLAIPTTFAAADTVEWRQAHHWNRIAGLGRFHLPAGKQVLTLHFLDQPVMNFDYMDFVKSAAP